MNRWGYLTCTGLLIALLCILFWPEDRSEEYRHVWQGAIPQAFTLSSSHLEQQVQDNQVRIQMPGPEGQIWERPLDAGAKARLWSTFSSLRANRWRDGIVAADLAAFGIDSWHLHAADVDLRWGRREGTTYLYNGQEQRLYLLAETSYDSLARHAGRLDDPSIIQAQDLQKDRILINDQRLHYDPASQSWLDDQRPYRPAFDIRLELLLEAISRLRIESLDAQSLQGDVVWGRVELQEALEFVQDEAGRDWVLGSGFPPQRLSVGLAAALRERLAAFERDPLLSIPLSGMLPTLARVEIERAGEWLLNIESEEGRDPAVDRQYTLRWPDGREDMDQRSVWQLQQDLGELYLRNVQQIDDTSPSLEQWLADIDAEEAPLVLRAWNQRGQAIIELHILQEHVRSGSHYGVLEEIPDLFAKLGPAYFLDRRLLRIDQERIVKWQRVRYEPDGSPHAEVFLRSPAGWQQRLPETGRVDNQAVDRLLWALTEAEAEAVLLPEGLPWPASEGSLALRILGRHSEDVRSEQDLLDSIDRDWGIELRRQDADRWLARVVDRELIYVLSTELVEACFAPLLDLPLLPVLPGQILAISLHQNESSYTLRRTTDGDWRLRQEDQDILADPGEVRRLLQSLRTAQAAAHDPDAPILRADEIIAKLEIQVPGADDAPDILSFAIGRPRQGLHPLSLTRRGSRIQSLGRYQVASAQIEELLSPARRYRPLREMIGDDDSGL